jgi:hypothetical protein
MNTDLIGRLRNTPLRKNNALMPLFEAIVNSILAIEEAKVKGGLIRIRIVRDESQQELDLHEKNISPIKSFIIEDNGIGFTDGNFKSFETIDSQAKIQHGGKGIGRLLWLKAFDHAEIESVFKDIGGWYRRKFQFRESPNGIENPAIEKLSAPDKLYTAVRLVHFRDEYRSAAPKSAETIARRIIEHCMQHFVLGTIPSIVIDDQAADRKLNLASIYREEYRPESDSTKFTVGGKRLSMTHVLMKPSSDSKHTLHFCAHKRVVQSFPLAGKIPHLRTALENDGESVMYSGFVQGKFLDKHVDPQRNSFSIDGVGELSLTGGPTREELVDSTMRIAQAYLEPMTAAIRDYSMKRTKEYIDNKAPRYKLLLKHRSNEVEQIPDNLSETNLEVELHKIYGSLKQQVHEKVIRSMEQVDTGTSDFEIHNETFRRAIGDFHEVSVSELTDYILHRATILSFFEKLLGRQSDEQFAKEDALHDLFFPRRKVSDDIDYDKHSLWIIDERLAYHTFLASDLPFNQHGGPLQIESEDRPDLLIYNNPLAFTPGEIPSPSVIILEFKRPERKDVGKDESPIQQVLRYVQLIRDGKAIRSDGSTIDLPPELPFYCYIIASLTDKLKQDAKERGYTLSPDGMGYFAYNANFKAYIEVLSYRKILQDALKRNRAFFDKLQIKWSPRP